MSQEEETSARVTRGALRRRSIDQDTSASAGPGTPKKTITSKKLALLDAIQEGANGPVDLTATDDDTSSTTRSTRMKKDTSFVAIKPAQKVKEEEKGNRRSRTVSLTEENLATLEASEARRTPRRRPSQDITLTPQTAPQPSRRVTRRNSVTSDDASLHSLPVTTPKASKSRLSVAPPTIAEDDEKEEKANNSNLETEMSDLDIRKLRNRSISNSPVPRGSPTGKNTSIGSQRTDEEVSPAKQAKVLLEDISETDSSQKTETAEVVASAMKISPMKQANVLLVDVADGELSQKASEASILVMDSLTVSPISQPTQKKPATVETTPVKGRKSVSSAASSAQKLPKNVAFEETPDRQNPNTYPKTPIAVSGGKRFKFGEPVCEEDGEQKVKSTPEMFEIDESVNESPKEDDQALESEAKLTQSPQKQTPQKQTPQKLTTQEQTPRKQTPKQQTPQKQLSANLLDRSVDASLANIVEDVRENINQVDLSISILGTPKHSEKQKSHFSRLREGSSSTPIPADKKTSTTPKKEQLQQAGSPKLVSNTPDGRGSQKKKDPAEESKHSKSWSQAVKGSGSDKGIDLFSVRKQEEENRQEEEAKKLNESLKRKSLEKKKSPKKMVSDDEDEDEDNQDEVSASELLGSDSPECNSFLDDEAMEVNDYESGDSLDSETRADMEDNEVKVDGESIGSQDSEHSDDNDEDDVDEEEEEEDDSFIASDNEEAELLDGTDDDLGSEEEDKKVSKKKRKRIIQQDDSSEEEKEVSGKNKSQDSLDKTTSASEGNASKIETSPSKSTKGKTLETTPNKSASKSPSNTLVAKTDTPKSQPNETPEKNKKKTPVNTPVQSSKIEQEATKLLPTPGKSPKGKNTLVGAEDAGDDEQVAAPKSRKSMPAAVLVSADFYSSSKKAKRNTIDALTNEDTESVEQPRKQEGKRKSSSLVTNPAALALAKKNKRLSLDPTATPAMVDKRASLPGKLPEDKQVNSPLKKKIVEEEENSVDAMDADKQSAESSPRKRKESPKAKPASKKKPKDLLEYDHDAILSRCNEIVRADKEKRKESASLRQKKKDDKRRQREQQEQDENAENGDVSMEHQKKKKKKSKKINYLLEELGETKEEQLAKALKRKQALLEVKRERKKAKKAAKLQQQLNKENQQGEGKGGIGAKFDKKAKKKKQLIEELTETTVVEPKPLVKRAISAFAVYSAEIEALKKQSLEKKKGKQLKEKNQQRSAADEVKDAFQAESSKTKKEKSVVKSLENETTLVAEKKFEESAAVPAADESKEKAKKEKKLDNVEKVSKKDINEDLHKKAKTPSNGQANIPQESKPKKKKMEQADSAPMKSTISLDEELAKLKQSLSEPITKVVKKQKLSQKESVTINFSEVEQTPPRKTTGGKLKALARLESGFLEEPTTPEQQQMRRNRGFKEEPVTPKAVGFRVSHILPAGQEELLRHVVAEKKKKKYVNSNRIQLEDVKEPVKGLPLPIWTRSGTFEVEEVAGKGGQKKSNKKAKAAESDYIPLTVNGTGSGKGSTEFLLKSLETKQAAGKHKAHRIDLATVDESVLNFKKQAIFGKSSHLREKKPKH